MEDIIDDILKGAIAAAGFQGYYEACNTNLSLATLMKSSKKNFPSFACENLKRKYSASSSIHKKLKYAENKENLQISKSKSPMPEFQNSQTCCICSNSIKNNIKRLMCHHKAHTSCLQDYFKSNSGCPECKSQNSRPLNLN